MTTYPYVIVGAGMAGNAAIAGIRSQDPTGEILVVGEEPFLPYPRPPLSKGLWRHDRMEELWENLDDGPFGVHYQLGSPVIEIDTPAHRICTDNGSQFAYEKLLLALGGRPRRLEGSAAYVYYPGTIREHVRLAARLRGDSKRIAVVGGGFIGSEMAAVLSEQGYQVTWILEENVPFMRTFPKVLQDRLMVAYQDHQVEIRGSSRVTKTTPHSGGVTIETTDGREITTEAAVIGIGWVLNDEVVRQSGLLEPDERGIPVDEYGRTRVANVFACGDIAITNDAKRVMLHEDHAPTQGRIVGRNMTGMLEPYREIPFFYSDLYAWGYEAVGEVDTRHRVVEDWVIPGEEGVVYYLDDTRLVGVLNWNVWEGVPKARALLARDRHWTARELIGQIRNGAIVK